MIRLATPIAAALLCLCMAEVCAAQSSPWTVDYAGERADVSNGGAGSWWNSDRVQAMWARPDIGGWLVALERDTRGDLTDIAISGRGYRRLGPWTIAGGASATPDADFLYRATADVEISRTLISSIVGSGAYRFLQFPTVDIDQLQPAVTWYHARGEVEGRAFITRNRTRERTTGAILARTSFAVNARLRLAAGAAVGDRIFDVASLPTSRNDSRVVFGSARVWITRRDSVEGGVSIASEDPAFTYRSLTIAYRRAF